MIKLVWSAFEYISSRCNIIIRLSFLDKNRSGIRVKSLRKMNLSLHTLFYHKLSYTVESVLSGTLKNRQNKGLKDKGSLMKVESNAECSLGAFCNTFDLH